VNHYTFFTFHGTLGWVRILYRVGFIIPSLLEKENIIYNPSYIVLKQYTLFKSTFMLFQVDISQLHVLS
jgi:hypothetical protein